MSIKTFLKSLRQYWIKNNIPNITDSNAIFLQNLILKNKSKKALEIGTANWYSAICFCMALQETSWTLITIEFSSNSCLQAKENIKKAWFDNICNIINANAIEYIPQIPQNDFDFIFIDWMKKRTKDFFKLIYDKTSKWWIIIVDDVIKFKNKMLDFYEYLDIKKIKYEIIKIDKDDWIMKIIKV